MAKLTIEIEENEFALYDVSVTVNGEFLYRDENFTSEEAAYNHALSSFGPIQTSIEDWNAFND